MKTKLMESQEACRRNDVTVLSPTIDVVAVATGPGSDPVVDDVSSNDALRLTTNVFELQIKYDPLVASLSRFTSQYVT